MLAPNDTVDTVEIDTCLLEVYMECQGDAIPDPVAIQIDDVYRHIYGAPSRTGCSRCQSTLAELGY